MIKREIHWFQKRASGYTPSPVVYQDRVFSIDDRGFLTVLDNASGEQLYRARVGEGITLSSSPWAYDGKVFLLSEDGNTYLLDAGASEYRELAVNRLDEMTLASPAFVQGALYLRTQTQLYKITNQE